MLRIWKRFKEYVDEFIVKNFFTLKELRKWFYIYVVVCMGNEKCGLVRCLSLLAWNKEETDLHNKVFYFHLAVKISKDSFT